MRHKGITLVGGAVVVGLLLIFVLSQALQRPSRFTSGLEWDRLTAENDSAFYFLVTNSSGTSDSPRSIEFQWIDNLGQTGICHAALSPQGPKRNGVVWAYIGIPADASKIRVRLCEIPPHPFRKKVQGILDASPSWVQKLVPARWVFRDEAKLPFLPWAANPTFHGRSAPPRH